MIISLPVQTAVWPRLGMGAFTVVVGVQLSAHSEEEIFGSLYGLDVRVRDVATAAFAPTYAYTLLASRSAKVRLARHYAMTKGSLPSASKSSPNTSGCLE